MIFPVHESETGFFQELAHKSDVDFGQLSILGIKPGCSRGGHYHSRKTEWFCCIAGSCMMQIFNVRTGESRAIGLSEEKREFVRVDPYESHSVENFIGNPMCEVLIIISEEYDSSDPDTFSF